MKDPSCIKLFFSFLRLGLGAFGGPAMVAYIEEMAVNKYAWLDNKTFKDGVALCQAIPGATAMQVAAYVGLRTKGVRGSLSTFVGFGLPAFVLMLLLSVLYARLSGLQQVLSVFAGLEVTVVAIIVNATISFGKGCLKDYRDVAVALVTALLFWLGISPFVVIIGAGLVGIVLFQGQTFGGNSSETGSLFHVKQAIVLFSILIASFLSLYFLDNRLFEIAALMVKVDLFAFGGGFASLPLLLNQVVEVKGWLDNKTFMDGVALGQITPGPIVITSTFVGYMVYGFPGAIVATLAMFAPSLFMLVLTSAFLDPIRKSHVFGKLTRAILASFVGLLFYTAIKFGANVPWEIMRVILGLAALVALLRKIDVLYIVVAASLVSVVAFR
jgi:chromate transporter